MVEYKYEEIVYQNKTFNFIINIECLNVSQIMELQIARWSDLLHVHE